MTTITKLFSKLTASDKPDLGLEELHSLNVKERFQVFEHHEDSNNFNVEKGGVVNVKRSPSILSKLAKWVALLDFCDIWKIAFEKILKITQIM